MKLIRNRISLDAGGRFVASFEAGVRAVYLIQGEHSELAYAQPRAIHEGETLEITALSPITIGVFEEDTDVVH